MLSTNTYWRNYYPFFDSNSVFGIRKTESLSCAGERAEVDFYRPERSRGTIVFVHGLGLCSGFCVPLCYHMFARGYTVVAPNLPGHNASRREGDFTMAACTDVVVCAVKEARRRFGDPVFLAGGSIGGALSYYAMAAGVDVRAAVCYCLFDCGDDAFRESFYAHSSLLRFLKCVNDRVWKFAPRLAIPFTSFLGFHIADKGFPEHWQEYRFVRDDVRMTKQLSLRALHSISSDGPLIPFADFTRIPIRVIVATRDRLLSTACIRDAYEQLGCEKDLVELDQDHWPVFEHEIKQSAVAICNWCDRYCT